MKTPKIGSVWKSVCYSYVFQIVPEIIDSISADNLVHICILVDTNQVDYCTFDAVLRHNFYDGTFVPAFDYVFKMQLATLLSE